MTGRNDLFFLHGFWGTPFDFEPLQKSLKEKSSPQIHTLELEQFSPIKGLKRWAKNFCEQALKVQGPRIVIGYSMGGRLALQAVMAQPDLWAGAVLISAHPGLRTPEEKAARTHWQNQWAENFLTLPQEDLEQEWEAQDVFHASTAMAKPKLTGPRRQFLAEALKYWGSDQHLFTWEDLKNCKTPLLWCAGEDDHKYVGLQQDMQNANLPGKFTIIPSAGHRLIFDQPEKLAQHIAEFMGELI